METGEHCQLLKIYVSEDSRFKGHSLYSAVVFQLKALGIAGVTVTRGIAGYGKGKALHTARILELSSSLPIVIEAVDTASQIASALPVIKNMVREGLILVADATVIQYGKD
ncbi:MAG: DUF190 domain-containing protein [Oscillospiraceae bacterium]|nr:DUF190 domain-containing protein [Oscillospiraceae bacterium]